MIRNSGNKHGQTYGNDAIVADDFISRQAIKLIGGTGSDFVDGVISGYAWKGDRITYAFPDSPNDYNYGGEKNNNFGTVNSKIKAAAEFILDTAYGGKANDGFALEGFTELKVGKGSDHGAALRYAESNKADPTAYAYFPSGSERGGDVWFGQRANYNDAVSGNYDFATVIHETGHALGLKHGHEPGFGNPAIPSQWDSLEYSVMTYHSYSGDDATGYSNEPYGYPQTFMMADIAALQHMYGANFKVNQGSTTYSWRPDSGNTYVNGKVAINPGGDNIFATIWDGGGNHDEYDLSAYRSNVVIDLHAGSYSTFKTSQLADLGKFDGNGKHIASGNIYNALQYEGDKRSLIEDAKGGTGNDILRGNQVDNRLIGNAGNDRLVGWQGNDILIGGKGNDTFVFENGWDRDTIKDFKGQDKIDLSDFGFFNLDDVKAIARNVGDHVILAFGDGDSLKIEHMQRFGLHDNDFIL